MRATFLAFILLTLPLMAQAGAWLQPAGHGYRALQAGWYENAHYFDRNSDLHAQATYRKQELLPYLEYGVNAHLTLGGTGALAYVEQSGSHTVGIADPEFFLRTALWQDAHQVLSLEPRLKLPSQFTETFPASGSRSIDGELALLYGRHLSWLSPRDYVDTRLGYRLRSDGLSAQIRSEASLALHPLADWTFAPGLRAIYTPTIETSYYREGAEMDQNLLKAELTVSYALSPTREVTATLYRHVAGTQAGDGGGLMLGIAGRF